MGIRESTFGKAFAKKAVALPLSFALAVGVAPPLAFANSGLSSAGFEPQAIEGQGAGSGAGAQVAPAASTETMYRLYLPILFRAENGMSEFSSDYQATDTSQWAPQYAVFDMGNDGVPELLVRTNSIFSGNSQVHVFTIDSGSVMQCGSYWELFGGSAGNSSGELFAAGWNAGSSYVSAEVLEGGQVFTKFAISGKATNDSPGGDVQAVNDYLSQHGAKWLTFTRTSDYSVLMGNAKYSLSKGALSVAAAGAYTGAAKTPAVTATFDGTTLVQGVDYEVTYANNVNAGTATATVTGKGDYQDSISQQFTIAQASIATSAVTVASAGSYTGAAKTPAVSASANGRALRLGADYTVAYKNNKGAGTATAVINGKGNYAGAKNVAFTIAKAANPMKAKSSGKTYKAASVAGAAQSYKPVSFSKKAQGKVTYKLVNSGASTVGKRFSVNASTGAITVKKGTAKGTYSVKLKVAAAGNGNYKPASETEAFKVVVK